MSLKIIDIGFEWWKRDRHSKDARKARRTDKRLGARKIRRESDREAEAREREAMILWDNLMAIENTTGLTE